MCQPQPRALHPQPCEVYRRRFFKGFAGCLIDTVAIVIHSNDGSDIESPGQRPRHRRWLLLCACIFVALGGLIVFRGMFPQIPPGVSRRDYDEASAEFRHQFNRDGDHFDVLMTLAEIAARNEDFGKAIACYQRIPPEHVRYGRSARYEEGLLLAQTDQVQRAEDSFSGFLKALENGIPLSERQVVHARRWLSLIFSVELRHEERHKVLKTLVQDDQADVNDAKQYYFESLLIWQSAFGSGRVGDFLKLDPMNRHLRNAEARYLTGQGHLEEARRRLTTLYLEDPQDLRTIAFLLECDFEMNDWSAFSAVFSKVPEFREDEPWLLTQSRGQWALHQQEWQEAEKHFRYMLEIDPPNATCLMGLTRALSEQGKKAESETLMQRSLVMAKLRVSLAAVSTDNAKAARDIAKLSRQIGMEDAATMFDQFAATMSTEGR